MKNLVVLSLDGVSQSQFNGFLRWMTPLYSFMKKATVFRRFFTASTSGFQSFCDFVFGDSSELDHNPYFPSGKGCLRGRAQNIFAELRTRGYEVMGAQRGDPCPAYAKENFWGAWPVECGAFRTYEAKDALFGEIEAFVQTASKNGIPFALYVSDRAAIPGDGGPGIHGSIQKTKSEQAQLNDIVNSDAGFYRNICEGMQFLGRVGGKLGTILREAGISSETVFVVMGNHGTDLWKHGLYGGRTHAIDPYADMCWTPLLILNNNQKVGVIDDLVSMIDLKPTIMHLLFADEPDAKPATPFSGINVFREKRKLVFSQRMFARQLEEQDRYKSMKRSYAIADGEQRLIVSSSGGNSEKGGMELYYDMRDPFNTRNILDFFDFDTQGFMTAFGRQDIIHPHFTRAFKPHLVLSILDSYDILRQNLYDHIRAKEAYAKTETNSDGWTPFPDQAFRVKRKK